MHMRERLGHVAVALLALPVFLKIWYATECTALLAVAFTERPLVLHTTCQIPIHKEFQELWPQLDVVFDGGELGSGDSKRAGSTVIDLSTPGRFRIIREGCAFKETKKLLEEFHLEEL